MLSVLLAALMQAATPAVADGSHLGPITDPQWQTVPTSVRDYYPAAALAQGVEGAAAVECRVSRDGRLTDCKVLAEQPEGGPFGQATIQVASQFRMQSKTQSGVATADRAIRLPVVFQMPWNHQDPAQAGVFRVAPPLPWMKLPTGNDIARVYPARAANQSVEGKATLHCTIESDGHLGACRAEEEQPAGWEFGDAVLKLAPLFRVDVTKSVGTLAPGKEISIPIMLRLPHG